MASLSKGYEIIKSCDEIVPGAIVISKDNATLWSENMLKSKGVFLMGQIGVVLDENKDLHGVMILVNGKIGWVDKWDIRVL